MSKCSLCTCDLDNGQPIVELRKKGADSLNNIGDDGINFEIGQKVHVNCRRDFCRDAGRKKNSGPTIATKVKSTISRRSSNPQFLWNEHCFFCGEPTKYDGRKKGFEVIPVRTEDLQNAISGICHERNDEWGSTVLGRLEYARDLHAVDAVYHNQCSVNFRTGKDVPCQYNSDHQTKKQKQAGRPQSVSRIDAFLKVVKYLEENDEEQFTVNDLCDKMNDFLKSSDDEAYSAVYMKDKLNDHFGDKVVMTTIKSKANIVTLRKTAASIINEFYCTPKQTDFEAEKAKIVSTAAQLIKSEIKNFEIATNIYPCGDEVSSTEDALKYVPNLLEQFLRSLFVGKDIDLKVAAIAQAMIQATRPRAIMAPSSIRSRRSDASSLCFEISN